MSYPVNRHEMERAYYTLQKREPCPKCGKPTELWKTRGDKGLRISIHEGDTAYTRVTMHWQECRKQQTQGPTFAHEDRVRAAKRLLDNSNARLVVAIFDDGHAYAYRHGIPAEDLRHELITTANAIRRDLEVKHG